MAGALEQRSYITVFVSRAHVFEVNHETKNSWLPKADSALPISIVANFIDADEQHHKNAPHKIRELRIIGTNEAGEKVLDALVVHKTEFTVRSSKFGQWTDPSGTIYGLGFNSDTDLADFMENFHKFQRELLASLSCQQSQPARPSQSILSNNLHQTQPNAGERMSRNMNGVIQSEMNGRDQQVAIKSSPPSNGPTLGSSSSQRETSQDGLMTSTQRRPQRPPPHLNGESSSTGQAHDTNNNPVSGYQRGRNPVISPQSRTGTASGKGSPDLDYQSGYQCDWQSRDQLIYANERLKAALEESSKNSGVWHNELLNLRTNNAKLTQALEESKSHVDQWQSELNKLRDENRELKVQIANLESNDGKGMQRYVEEIQGELRRKDEEIEELQRDMEEMEIKARSASSNFATEDTIGQQRISTQTLDKLSGQLEAIVTDLANVQSELAHTVQKLHS